MHCELIADFELLERLIAVALIPLTAVLHSTQSGYLLDYPEAVSAAEKSGSEVTPKRSRRGNKRCWMLWHFRHDSVWWSVHDLTAVAGIGAGRVLMEQGRPTAGCTFCGEVGRRAEAT